MGVIGASADKAFIGDETGGHRLVHIGDDLADFGHGFRANAVTGEEEERARRHGKPFFTLKDRWPGS